MKSAIFLTLNNTNDYWSHMNANSLLYSAYLPLLLFILVALIKWSRLTPLIRTFMPYIFFELGMQLTASTLAYYNANNLFLLYYYAPISLALLLFFYERVLSNFLDKKIFRSVSITFVLFTVFDALFIEETSAFGSYLLTVRSILLLITALSTLSLTLNKEFTRTESQKGEGLNWINYGVLIYHSSCLLLFYFGKKIMELFSIEANQYTWLIHSFFAFVMYVCFLVGLWKSPKR